MKKLSLFAFAAAALLLGACSSDDDVVVKNPVNQDFKDGAYIGLSLQLPSADATTRANDELSNGTEDEFDVKNATLYIFKAATTEDNPDANATFVANVSLGNQYDPDTQGGIDPDKWGVQGGVNTTNITSTYNEATLIPNDLATQMKEDNANKYYAYVIINHNGQVAAPTGTTTFAQFSKQEFTAIGADIAAEKNIYGTGLLMTNSPYSSVKGGNANPTAGAVYSTLVPLDNQNIFGSKAEALAEPAACVYVERAAVKITVEDNRTTKTIGEGTNAVNVTLDGWQVINYEPKYYNTRQIEAVWGPYVNYQKADPVAYNSYRFVSVNPFSPTLPAGTNVEHTTAYRTYFAKDLQYDKNATLRKTVAAINGPWIAPGSHAYTTENTFDVAHQTWQNTTMVTIKATIGTNGFYTVGKGGQVMYVTDDTKTGLQKALDVIENIVKADNDVAQALTDLRAKISANNSSTDVQSGLTLTATAPAAGKTGVPFNIALDFTIDGTPYTAFDGTDEAALKTTLENAINAVIYVDPAATQKEYSDVVLLSYYKDGVSYYNVRIQHFGDAETPWGATGDHIYGGGNGVNEIYFGIANDENPTAVQTTTAEKNFLGRYGVVRDNWYKLDVTQIGRIGDAEPVDPSTTTPDTPDDEIENYISVHVHIVPWVLRSQTVQF